MTAAIVVVGGATIVVGTLLPWMTLFAGLHTLPGVTGLYGRLMAGGGILAIGLGVYLSVRGGRLITFATGGLGVGILFSTTILLRNMMAIVEQHRGDPMMVARAGSGLYVCLGGAVLLCGAVSAQLFSTPRN